MHKFYFPRCPIDGPIEPPVPFSHGGSFGAVPSKCGACAHLFEGQCTRSIKEVGRYLHLDHGPCGIDGPTDPIVYEDDFIRSKVEIPRKCLRCPHLKINPTSGFSCSKDGDKWGDFHRGLDWGTWEPDDVYVELPPPKVTSRELALYARQGDLISFVQEYRRINAGRSIQEAKADFARFREIYRKFRDEVSGE